MDFYSRMVAFFKVLLPLAALAILATLFLLSRGIDLEATIPFAEGEISERTREQQITGPYFSGTTANGDEIIVNADLVRPGGPQTPATATNVSAQMTKAGGGRMTMNADRASVDPAADMATFSGDVLIGTSTGIQVRTNELNTALSGVSGSTPGEVSGTSPFGKFTAGQMSFGPQDGAATEEAENGSAPLHVLFKGGVKLIYRPKKSE